MIAATAFDRVTITPQDRRAVILSAIDSARSSVRLSMFRCTDFKVLDKLGEALQRGVSVELLLTQRAKGWEKKIREIGNYIESMGARVHRYALPTIKYHAKYLVVDETAAVISSANLTVKCFEKTADFFLHTTDPAVVASLIWLFELDTAAPGSALPASLSPRLIIGPDASRSGFRAALAAAQRGLRIVDHRVKDPEIIALLRDRERAGVDVQIYGKRSVPGLKSHGKLTIIDDSTAILGSIALSQPGLGARRELSVQITEPACLAAFKQFLDGAGSGVPVGMLKGAALLAFDDDDDDEEDDDE